MASAPDSISSWPTVGPTNSVRRYSTPGPSASRTRLVALIWAASSPVCRWIRIRSSRSAPNSCRLTSPTPNPFRVLRSPEISAGPGVRTSIRMPPLKSIPKFSPAVASATNEPRTRTAERTKQKTRARSTGTRAPRGMNRTGFSMMRFPGSDRQHGGTPAAHPDHRDQPRHHHRGEHGSEDADTERHREAFDRPRPERIQEHHREQRRQVRIDDRRPGSLVAGVHRIDRRPAVVDLLAYSLEHQDIGVHRHAHGEDDAGDPR